MTVIRKLGIAVVVLIAIGAAGWLASDNVRNGVFLALRAAHFAVRPVPPRCKQRAAELQARVALIQRDAKNSLRIGSNRDDVVRFFASENVPLGLTQIGQDHEATGAIYIKGLPECENVACGDDSALIGVRVKVDIDGTVISDPVITGMYTDCL